MKLFKMEQKNVGKIVIGVIFSVLFFIVILMFGLPRYNVWEQEMAGNA